MALTRWYDPSRNLVLFQRSRFRSSQSEISQEAGGDLRIDVRMRMGCAPGPNLLGGGCVRRRWGFLLPPPRWARGSTPSETPPGVFDLIRIGRSERPPTVLPGVGLGDIPWLFTICSWDYRQSRRVGVLDFPIFARPD